MKPFYEQDGITIYHGDCREILPQLPKVDLVLTDPPYGINYKGGVGGNLIHSKGKRRSERVIGDDEPFDPSPFLDFPLTVFFGAQHFYDRLPAGGAFHVWDKRGDYRPVHTSDFDLIWISRRLEVGRIIRCVWRGLCRETEAQNKIVHPTQKPVRLMSDLIHRLPGETILDPFVGSGTTLLAAKLEGRKAIGIEINEAYCEIAANRLRQKVMYPPEMATL